MVSLGTQPANRKSGFGHSSPTGARAQDLSRQPARPDLWGARVSNDPGLPDPQSNPHYHRWSSVKFFSHPLWVGCEPFKDLVGENCELYRGFLGDLIAWEDGVYGTSKSVFAAGACCAMRSCICRVRCGTRPIMR